MADEEKIVLYASTKPSLNFRLKNGQHIRFKNGVFEARGPYIEWMEAWLRGAPPRSKSMIRIIDLNKAREVALAHQKTLKGVAAQGPMSSLARGKQVEQARILTEATRLGNIGAEGMQEAVKDLSAGLTAGDDPSFVVAQTVLPEKPAKPFHSLIFPGQKSK